MILATVTTSGFDQAKASVANVQAALRVAGRAVSSQEKAWLRAKNASEPNRLGGVRTNFWSKVASSVHQPITTGQESVSIEVTHPHFAQKYLGGDIVPKRVKWLTIPANALAYGKSASSFNLAFIFINSNLAMLVRKTDMKRTREFGSQRRIGGRVDNITQSIKQNAGTVMYWLKKRVHQKPTDGCFPAQSAMEDTARSAYSAYLTMIFNRPAKS